MWLPASAWTPLGTPPGARGYRYSDDDQALGPCTKAQVDGRRTKARCAGAGIAFSLDESSQGSLDVRFAVGSDPLTRCFHFGGVSKDVPGSFAARRAPAPLACD